jgi:hypothetical protein
MIAVAKIPFMHGVLRLAEAILCPAGSRECLEHPPPYSQTSLTIRMISGQMLRDTHELPAVAADPVLARQTRMICCVATRESPGLGPAGG